MIVAGRAVVRHHAHAMMMACMMTWGLCRECASHPRRQEACESKDGQNEAEPTEHMEPIYTKRPAKAKRRSSALTWIRRRQRRALM